MVLFIVLLDSLPYDSKLSGEESFLQDYLLELHIRQGNVHDLKKLRVFFVYTVE
jgi:hypothetical protein